MTKRASLRPASLYVRGSTLGSSDSLTCHPAGLGIRTYAGPQFYWQISLLRGSVLPTSQFSDSPSRRAADFDADLVSPILDAGKPYPEHVSTSSCQQHRDHQEIKILTPNTGHQETRIQPKVAK